MLSTEESSVFKALEVSLETLKRARQLACAPGMAIRAQWFDSSGNEFSDDPGPTFGAAIADLEFQADAENGVVTRHVGVIEAGGALIQCLHELNAQRKSLRLAATQLTGNAKERSRKLRHVLSSAGLANAHPLQCWRQIPVALPEPIKTLGFSRIKNSWSSEKITLAEARARLTEHSASVELEMLNQWAKSGDLELRWQVPVKEFGKANLSYVTERGSANATLCASLPMVVYEGTYPSKVKFNKPSDKRIQRKEGIAEKDVIALPFRQDARLYRSSSPQA